MWYWQPTSNLDNIQRYAPRERCTSVTHGEYTSAAEESAFASHVAKLGQRRSEKTVSMSFKV